MPTEEKKWGHARLPLDIWREIQETAKKEQRTLAAVLRRAWEQYKKRK